MNPDFIIGSNNPHILYADYSGGRRTGGALATPESASTDAPESARAVVPELSSENSAQSARAVVREASAERTERTAHTQGAPEAESQELTFGDILDILNPLQHIPIISQIYRAVTGDKISGFATVAGGALFGGPLGLVGGVIEAATEAVTGKGAGETFVASLLGEDQQPQTQIASSDGPPDEDETLETQVATATPPAGDDEELPKMATSSPPSGNDRLDTQIAAGMLPPIAPPTQMAQAEKPKAPYGGIMDMTTVTAAKGAPNIADEPALAAAEPVPTQSASSARAVVPDAPGAVAVARSAEQSRQDKAVPIGILPHAPAMMDGHTVYSLAGVRRRGGTEPVMPAYSGPDVRLKPVTRQSGTTGRIAEPRSVHAVTPDAPGAVAVARSAEQSRQQNAVDAEAQRILGLAKPAAPVAENTSTLTPADADLLPSSGGSDPIPAALIEDMMKMGLEKYQKGLNNGTLQARPGVDVRG